MAADYTSPMPMTSRLPDRVFTERSDMVGIDLREDDQLRLLDRIRAFKPEFDRFELGPTPGESFYVKNDMFQSVDAEVAYSMVRLLKPNRIVEVGSGWSTIVMALALAENESDGHVGRVLSIDPEPRTSWPSQLARYIEHRAEPVEEVGLAVFEALQEDDILFLDSSHMLRLGGDVRFEVLEVLPRLAVGVSVHVHDIFLPSNYPRSTVRACDFYNEQYLLQAFLAFNRTFQVVWGSSSMHLDHSSALSQTFASYDSARDWPVSFWLSKTAP